MKYSRTCDIWSVHPIGFICKFWNKPTTHLICFVCVYLEIILLAYYTRAEVMGWDKEISVVNILLNLKIHNSKGHTCIWPIIVIIFSIPTYGGWNPLNIFFLDFAENYQKKFGNYYNIIDPQILKDCHYCFLNINM